MRRGALTILALATSALWLAPLAAQETTAAATAPAERTPLETRAANVVDAINGKADPAKVFSPGFLKAVPPAQLAAVSASFTAKCNTR